MKVFYVEGQFQEEVWPCSSTEKYDCEVFTLREAAQRLCDTLKSCHPRNEYTVKELN